MSAPPSGASPAPSATPPEAPRPTPVVKRAPNRTPLYLVIAVVAVVVIVVAAAYATGVFNSKSSKPGACPTGVTLLGAGANFISTLMSSWTGSTSAAFNAQTGNGINYNAAGAGTGITDITTKTVDFAATDDPLSTSQISALPSPILTVPITGGALAIPYNLPGITQPVQLTGAIVAQIYLGTITTWNNSAIQAINSGITLPDQTIVTIHRSNAAGTTFVLTDWLTKDSSAWASKIGKNIQISWPGPKVPDQLAASSNSLIMSDIKNTQYSIGYVDLSDVLNAAWTQVASLQNPSGHYVLPTEASATSAITDVAANTTFPAASATSQWVNVSMVNGQAPADYPLATLAYFFVYTAVDAGYTTKLANAQVLVEWLTWTVGTGQGYATADNYVPLPNALVTLDQTAIGELTFAGKGIPACSIPS
jgi:phosphate transport system substrate-binding protein